MFQSGANVFNTRRFRKMLKNAYFRCENRPWSSRDWAFRSFLNIGMALWQCQGASFHSDYSRELTDNCVGACVSSEAPTTFHDIPFPLQGIMCARNARADVSCRSCREAPKRKKKGSWFSRGLKRTHEARDRRRRRGRWGRQRSSRGLVHPTPPTKVSTNVWKRSWCNYFEHVKLNRSQYLNEIRCTTGGST